MHEDQGDDSARHTEQLSALTLLMYQAAQDPERWAEMTALLWHKMALDIKEKYSLCRVDFGLMEKLSLMSRHKIDRYLIELSRKQQQTPELF